MSSRVLSINRTKTGQFKAFCNVLKLHSFEGLEKRWDFVRNLNTLSRKQEDKKQKRQEQIKITINNQ